MEIINTKLDGLILIKPKVFEDERGYFFESYNQSLFKNAGYDLNFVQDNQSLSHKGVLRGMHFQNEPYAQGKLVRVISGAVFDAVVDIRKNSPTFGQWFGEELTAKNKLMMYVPPGFAHGFLTLENNTIFSYKCTNFYNKASEDCLIWNDSDVNINWNFENPQLSPKDLEGKSFRNLNSLF